MWYIPQTKPKHVILLQFKIAKNLNNNAIWAHTVSMKQHDSIVIYWYKNVLFNLLFLFQKHHLLRIMHTMSQYTPQLPLGKFQILRQHQLKVGPEHNVDTQKGIVTKNSKSGLFPTFCSLSTLLIYVLSVQLYKSAHVYKTSCHTHRALSHFKV